MNFGTILQFHDISFNFLLGIYLIKNKVVPEGWAVTVTAQPSGTTLIKNTKSKAKLVLETDRVEIRIVLH